MNEPWGAWTNTPGVIPARSAQAGPSRSRGNLALDPSRHVIFPSVGVRGMLHHIVNALGHVPSS